MRCAWHRRYFGYRVVYRVASWRGGGLRFSDGICDTCTRLFRAESWGEGLDGPTPRIVPQWMPRTGLAVAVLVALVLAARPIDQPTRAPMGAGSADHVRAPAISREASFSSGLEGAVARASGSADASRSERAIPAGAPALSERAPANRLHAATSLRARDAKRERRPDRRTSPIASTFVPSGRALPVVVRARLDVGTGTPTRVSADGCRHVPARVATLPAVVAMSRAAAPLTPTSCRETTPAVAPMVAMVTVVEAP